MLRWSSGLGHLGRRVLRPQGGRRSCTPATPGEGSLTSQEEDAEGREKTQEGKCRLTWTMALGAEEHSGKMTLFQSLMDAAAAQCGRKRHRQGHERWQKAGRPGVSKAGTPGNCHHTGQDHHRQHTAGAPSPRGGASILCSTLEALQVTIGGGGYVNIFCCEIT